MRPDATRIEKELADVSDRSELRAAFGRLIDIYCGLFLVGAGDARRLVGNAGGQGAARGRACRKPG